jgi:hypothetical protein
MVNSTISAPDHQARKQSMSQESASINQPFQKPSKGMLVQAQEDPVRAETKDVSIQKAWKPDTSHLKYEKSRALSV